MTTSPEALREAVERAEQSLFLCGPDGPIGCQGQINNERSAKLLHADLRTLLSALQEAREALRLARDFAEQEIECRGYAGGEKTDYQDEAQKVFDTCDAVLFRYSSGRALSPGGADE